MTDKRIYLSRCICLFFHHTSYAIRREKKKKKQQLDFHLSPIVFQIAKKKTMSALSWSHHVRTEFTHKQNTLLLTPFLHQLSFVILDFIYASMRIYLLTYITSL